MSAFSVCRTPPPIAELLNFRRLWDPAITCVSTHKNTEGRDTRIPTDPGVLRCKELILTRLEQMGCPSSAELFAFYSNDFSFAQWLVWRDWFLTHYGRARKVAFNAYVVKFGSDHAKIYADKRA